MYSLGSAGKILSDVSQSLKYDWVPQAGPQTDLLTCPVEDVCIGGARGGGKTLGLILDWLQHATKYGRHAHGAIFRKRFTPDLQDVIRKANLVLVEALGWKYHGTEHRFTSPEGAVLHALYCETLEDAMNYKGFEWTWLGVDEIGDWADPAPIDFLWACLRSAEGVPCFRRTSCNPGGPGHIWVKKRYDPEHPFIVRSWQPQPEEAPHVRIKSVFIPALLDDNPLLLANDPTYEGRLASSGTRELYRAWRYGKWDMIAGQYFDIWDPRAHVVKLMPHGMDLTSREASIAPWHQRWISADWGFNDETVILWHAIGESGKVVTYREHVTNHTEPRALGEQIVDLTGPDEKIHAFYLSKDAYDKRTSPRTIAEEIGDAVSLGGIPRPCLADTDRVGGWQLMYQMLSRGTWKISNSCTRLIETMPLLQRDEKKINDIAQSKNDHAAEAARYGLKTHVRQVNVPLEERVNQALKGRESQDPTIAMLQRRIVTASLRKSQHTAFRSKPKRRYAA